MNRSGYNDTLRLWLTASEELLDLKFEVWQIAGELRRTIDGNDLQAIKSAVARLSTRLKELSILAKEADDKSSTVVVTEESVE